MFDLLKNAVNSPDRELSKVQVERTLYDIAMNIRVSASVETTIGTIAPTPPTGGVEETEDWKQRVTLPNVTFVSEVTGKLMMM